MRRTKNEYDAFVARFNEFMDNAGLENISPITDASGEWINEEWTVCDVCRQHGECYKCSGYNRTRKVVLDGYDVCHDCVYFATYGKLDDETMMAVEKDAQRPDRNKLCGLLSVEDTLPNNADGCPIVYLFEDGGECCPQCANRPEVMSKDARDDRQWNLVSFYVHYEGQPALCSCCDALTESAYGVNEEIIDGLTGEPI